MVPFPRLTARFFLGLFLALGLLACSFPYMLMAALRDPTVTPTVTTTGTVTDTTTPSPTLSATPSATGSPEPTFAAATVTNTFTASVPAPVQTVYTPVAALGAPNMLNPLSVSEKMRPYYQWSPVTNATLYTIWVWVLDKDGNKKDLVIYEQHQASHICGDTMCMIRPDYQLTEGKRYTWVVQAYGLPGYGPFSSQITFNASKITATPGSGTPVCPLTVAGKFGGGSVKAVAYDNGKQLTFISEGSVLAVFKNGDYSKPKTSITFSAEINNISVYENYAYIANSSKGLRIVYYSDDGSSLAEVGFENTNSTAANDIKYYSNGSEKYVLVADGSKGLVLFNVQDPQNPVYKLAYAGTAKKIFVDDTGKKVYAAFGSSGVYQFDLISIPSSFGVVQYNNTDIKSANAVTYGSDGANPYVWVADGTNGIVRLPMSAFYEKGSSEPTPQATPMNKIDSGNTTALDLIYYNNNYIFSLGSSIITRYLTSNPSTSVSYDFLHGASNFIIDSNNLYVADGSYGLRIMAIVGDPPVPQNSDAVYDSSINAYDVKVGMIGNIPYAFIADNNGRFVKLDVSTPNAPSMVASGNINLPGAPYALAIDNSFANAYIAANDGDLQVLNSQVLPISVHHTCNTNGYPKDVSLYSDFAVVASGDAGIELCKAYGDYSKLNTVAIPSGLANGLKIIGNQAFVAAYQGGLALYDLSTPIAPGTPDPPRKIWDANYNPTTGTYARAVDVAGSYAYLALDSNGLQVVDISQPTPAYKSSLDTAGTTYDVQVFNYDQSSYVALADYGSGVNIVNIDDPSKPVSACTLDTAGNARALYVYNKMIYVADESNGLVILSMP